MYPQQQLYQQAPALAQQAQAQAARVYPQQQAQQRQPYQQPYHQVQQPIVDNTTPIAQLPPTPVYSQNHRIPQSTSGETCIVELPIDPTDFRVTVIKPYLQELDTSTDTSIEQEPQQDSSIESTDGPQIEQDTPLEINEIRRNTSRRRQPPNRFQNMADITIYMSKPPLPNFQMSRLKELNGLLEKGVFEIMNKQDVPAETRIFDSRFVYQIKNKGTEKAFEKSRLIVQAFNDSGKHEILTQASIIQRASQRLTIAL